MQIQLDLSRHCIETAAKLKVEALIRCYFKTQSPETDRRIQVLTRFLEKADFHNLRHAMAKETDLNDTTAHLLFPEDMNRMEIRFRGKAFYPLLPHGNPM